VVSERQEEVKDVFLKKAKECGSEIYFAQDHYTIVEHGNKLDIDKDKIQYINQLALPLKGIYQVKNLAGVLKTVDILKELGFDISFKSLVNGLENCVDQTGLKGRWQTLGEHPMIICDTGHNAAGVREVVKQLHQQKFATLHMVWGMVKDKEVDEILNLLPVAAQYYFCQAKIPRSLDAEVLHEKAKQFDLFGEVIPDVNTALNKAIQQAASNDFIFVGGSTFVVAEIENL
jgi:dihydrofolate synthase/folylpolyglutamate synthase